MIAHLINRFHLPSKENGLYKDECHWVILRILPTTSRLRIWVFVSVKENYWRFCRRMYLAERWVLERSLGTSVQLGLKWGQSEGGEAKRAGMEWWQLGVRQAQGKLRGDRWEGNEERLAGAWWHLGTLSRPLFHPIFITHLWGRRHYSLHSTNKKTDKSPYISVLQRSYSGYVVLTIWLSSPLPGVQEKEIVRDRLMALFSCATPAPAIYPLLTSMGKSFPSETFWGISLRGIQLRTAEIPFILQNLQRS